jgi:hypothetical protein
VVRAISFFINSPFKWQLARPTATASQIQAVGFCIFPLRVASGGMPESLCPITAGIPNSQELTDTGIHANSRTMCMLFGQARKMLAPEACKELGNEKASRARSPWAYDGNSSGG